MMMNDTVLQCLHQRGGLAHFLPWETAAWGDWLVLSRGWLGRDGNGQDILRAQLRLLCASSVQGTNCTGEH